MTNCASCGKQTGTRTYLWHCQEYCSVGCMNKGFNHIVIDVHRDGDIY